jgi:outer membrane protein OmpA-like peptidoglycan-associated protein
MCRHLLLSSLLFVLAQGCWATSPLKLHRGIYFAENSYSLNERQLEMVGAIACSTIASNAPVVVRAYASSHERNAKGLAMLRLRYVQKLLTQHGVPKEHVLVESKGDAYPVADERSRLGRAKNRHIQVEGLGFLKRDVCGPISVDDPKYTREAIRAM